MKLLEMICKELGVEVGEEWKNDVRDTYKITDKGLYLKFAENDWEPCNRHDYIRLLTGKLKPVWRPKIGEVYYIPRIAAFKSNRYYKIGWENDDYDKWYLSNKMVFKTKEEAIRASNKLLEVLKNE